MVNSKHAFWQAFIVTIAIFIIGLFIGFAIESNRSAEASGAFIKSELFLIDSFALSKLTQSFDKGTISCESLLDTNIKFADKIYSEAKVFEKYGESEKLTSDVKLILKRYDLLRTLLWINTIEIPNECMQNVSIIVYLYERDSKDLTKLAKNRVWERILLDLKKNVGNKIILIPIAVDSDLTSLNALLSNFDIEEYPVVIIDEKHVLSEIESVEQLKFYLK